MEMLSRTNTQALKGFAIIAIIILHILWEFEAPRFFNVWDAPFVTVFLILSGYGLEESFRKNGLNGYWQKRIEKVVLPFMFFVCVYNNIFPFFFSDGMFPLDDAMHRCLDELLYVSPMFWFVFFIMKCYTVYWIGTRFMSERLRLLFFTFCAVVFLNIQAPSGHLEAEQSFSFLAGVLISINKHRMEALSDKEIKRWMFLLLFIAAVFIGLKTIPQIHELKGSIAYNYLLCPIRLSLGLAYIPLFTMFHPNRISLLRVAGKYSLEIYIAHMPFVSLINGDALSTVIFFACSAFAFTILLVYRRYVDKKLSAAEALFIIVNVLFVAKYSSRITGAASLCATLSAVVLYYVLLRLVIPYIYIGNSKFKISKFKIISAFCLLAFGGMVAVQYAIDPYGLQVDRWSALHFPIQNLLGGIYPYTANTHLGGSASPFPVWQILHIPFYLMGNVGLSFFVAAALFLWSCWKVQGREKALVTGLLLCSSVAVWYEVAVRSDLITNMLLLAAIINLVFHRMSQQWVEERRCWIACAVGLLACTRILVLIPITVLLLPYFVRMSWRRQIGVVLLTMVVFALTFAPFALWDWQEFYYFQNNPWALQTRQGNLSDFMLFVPLAIFLAMNHQGNVIRYYRNSAIMLVAFVAVTFVHNMYAGENWDLFSSTYDITYFTTALPFCLLAVCGEKVKCLSV